MSEGLKGATLLEQLVAAATAAATVHGYRQALEQVAANLRQQARAWRDQVGKPPRLLHIRAWQKWRELRSEAHRWAAQLEQIATTLEAEAKKREREQITHQRAAESRMAQVKQQLERPAAVETAGFLGRILRR